jgi:NAD(P)-dependent dehydrogenase (short-subunit alcohol dehydrogenase family)
LCDGSNAFNRKSTWTTNSNNSQARRQSRNRRWLSSRGRWPVSAAQRLWHSPGRAAASWSPDAGEALAEELRALGAQAWFVAADVRSEDDVDTLVARTIERFGRLDVAVNNAGTEGTSGPLTEQTLESYDSTFDTNVRGAFLSMKHELRVMQRQGFGSVVNISSTMGERGAGNMSMYVGSKHAVEGMTKSAAIEAAAYGVRVNAIAPGPTETAMLDRLTSTTPAGKAAFYATVPLKRGGTPEEIAEAIVFIASDKASFITGQIVRVNGGRTAS